MILISYRFPDFLINSAFQEISNYGATRIAMVRGHCTNWSVGVALSMTLLDWLLVINFLSAIIYVNGLREIFSAGVANFRAVFIAYTYGHGLILYMYIYGFVRRDLKRKV